MFWTKLKVRATAREAPKGIWRCQNEKMYGGPPKLPQESAADSLMIVKVRPMPAAAHLSFARHGLQEICNAELTVITPTLLLTHESGFSCNLSVSRLGPSYETLLLDNPWALSGNIESVL